MLEIAGNYSTPHAGNLEFEEVLEMLEIPACCKNFATLRCTRSLTSGNFEHVLKISETENL